MVTIARPHLLRLMGLLLGRRQVLRRCEPRIVECLYQIQANTASALLPGGFLAFMHLRP